jgi:1-acyl-sn-glycerol-3-phosphate acyltransferase
VKLWRLVQTGIGFAVFGAVVLALGFVAIPLSRRIARDPAADELRAQRWVHRGARVFIGYMRAVGLLRLDLEGAERLRTGRPLLLVANHPTLIDLVVLASLMPQLDCIVSASWADNPFLRRTVVAAGYIRSDAGGSVARACLRLLKAGRCVVLFPEGTRSPPGGLRDFQAGAAFVALRSGQPLLPVLLSCEPSTLTKGRSWYDVPAEQLHVTVRVGESILAQPVRYRDVTLPEAARRLTAELREVFLKGLDSADVGTA